MSINVFERGVSVKVDTKVPTDEQLSGWVCSLFEFGSDKWFDYESEFKALAMLIIDNYAPAAPVSPTPQPVGERLPAGLDDWIMVETALPQHGQLIEGRNAKGRVWKETWDTSEPIGLMKHWRPVNPEPLGDIPSRSERLHGAATHSPLPWRIDPDDRPDMEWNNHIVSVSEPGTTICFMTHDGTPDNAIGFGNARLIVNAVNAYAAPAPPVDDGLVAPLTYLAAPYSHPDRSVRVARFEAINKVAAKLMSDGALVYSPISHTHPIAEAGSLPIGWDFWQTYDKAFIYHSRKVVVLMLDGWQQSKGVTAEIAIATDAGIPIEYLEAAALSRSGGEG